MAASMDTAACLSVKPVNHVRRTNMPRAQCRFSSSMHHSGPTTCGSLRKSSSRRQHETRSASAPASAHLPTSHCCQQQVISCNCNCDCKPCPASSCGTSRLTVVAVLSTQFQEHDSAVHRCRSAAELLWRQCRFRVARARKTEECLQIARRELHCGSNNFGSA